MQALHRPTRERASPNELHSLRTKLNFLIHSFVDGTDYKTLKLTLLRNIVGADGVSASLGNGVGVVVGGFRPRWVMVSAWMWVGFGLVG